MFVSAIKTRAGLFSFISFSCIYFHLENCDEMCDTSNMFLATFIIKNPKM